MITLDKQWLNLLSKITASTLLSITLTACGGGGGDGDGDGDDPNIEPPIEVETRTFALEVSDLDIRRSVNDAPISVDLALAKSGTAQLTIDN